MNTPRSDKAWKAYKHSGNAQHIRSESCRLEAELDAIKAKLEKCRTALERLRDCDWVITLPDRMDAVRSIAREVLEETK